MNDLSEMRELLAWIGNPPRSPRQTHGLNESDSEVVRLGFRARLGAKLASTVDSVSEEIATGLYRDPYTMGWIAATASLSDLAAVGAEPIGALLSAHWDTSFDAARKARAAEGFSDALREAGTYWLGGDSGEAAGTVLTGVGLGLCGSKPLSRVGIRPGDVICATGPLGMGGALALRFLSGEAESEFPEELYRPRARLREGRALVGIARTAMDTSDGLLSTLRTLAAMNGCGFELEWNPSTLSEPARLYCERRKLPLILLWGSEHGEFELVAAVPEKSWKKARARLPGLIPLGRAINASESSLRLPDGRRSELDLGFVRSILDAHRGELPKAFATLVGYARERGLP